MTNNSTNAQSPRSPSHLFLLVCLVLIGSGCRWVDVVSENSTGQGGNAASSITFRSISADGHYVVFQSEATNLVENDENGEWDIFVRDTREGTTSLVSVDSAGNQQNSGSLHAAISEDGRFVVFDSYASNLVTNDTNSTWDVFVHDLASGITTRVSVDSDGNEGNSNSWRPTISHDGRYIAFKSWASNLVDQDTNGTPDIFVHDRHTGSTTRVNVDSAGNQGGGNADYAALSGDGRYVAFSTYDSLLVEGDTNIKSDVFVHDRNTGATTRISIDSAGNQGNANSGLATLSTDGRYISFASSANNLVTGDTNNHDDIFVHDRDTGATTRINVDSAGNQANNVSQSPSISGDGRYIAFYSLSTNLVADDTNAQYDIFVHDRNTGATTRASSNALGLESDGNNLTPSISSNGRYVAFETDATNLVPHDLNGYRDIAVSAIPEVSIDSVIPSMLPIGATTSVTISGTNFLPGAIPYVGGALLGNIMVVDENTITVDVTVQATKLAGARSVSISLLGTGAGPASGAAVFCNGCATFF